MMKAHAAGLTAVALGASWLAAAPAAAHHSFAMFDDKKEVVLEGTVREFQWKNPHVWVQVLVKNADGSVTEWGIEYGNTMQLQREGWKRTSFKPGDKVTLTVNPRRDGKPMGGFVQAILADGSKLTKTQEYAQTSK